MPWPPSKDFLPGDDIQIPILWLDFSTVLTAGRKTAGVRGKVVQSITQDISKTTTRAVDDAKIPVFGYDHAPSNRQYRDCNHSTSFWALCSYFYLLELETAMCDSITDKVGILPRCRGKAAKLRISCWNNFDLREETPAEAGITHSTHEVIIQELSNSTDSR